MILSIDIETKSSVDLAKCGVYKYTEDKSFEILLIAYAFDNEPVSVIDIKCGDLIPSRVREAILNPKIIKSAFNANFERVCLSKYFNTYLEPESFECSQVKALSLGLMPGLDNVANILDLDIRKAKEGKSLIKYFNTHPPSSDLKKWEAFKNYCKTDCEIEIEIRKKLSKYKLSEKELKLYHIDQRINDRGILVDKDLIDSAININNYYEDILKAKLKKLTNIDNIKSVVQVKNYLNNNFNIKLDSLNKANIEKIIETTADENLKEILNLRQELNKTSVKKYEAMKNTMCKDYRIRGLFQFYGANKTGRWSGRLVQVQNLPQNKVSINLPRSILKDNKDYKEAFELLDILYDNPKSILSQLIRTAFIPKKNHKFIISDFSAIEARVIAYLSKEKWRNEVFNTHGKIYEASASKMFKVPIEDITKDSDLRQKGKIAELALGYQGGKNALMKMGADNIGLSDEEIIELVKAFRNSNTNIVNLWRSLEEGAIKCVKDKVVVRINEHIEMFSDNNFLFIKLPSGRKLAYFKPRVEMDCNFNKEVLSYMSLNQTTKKFEKTYTYGGKLTENVVQAVARDVLCEKLMEFEKEGLDVVMHVHDEVVLEVREDFEVDVVNEIMEREVEWVKGLRLRADTIQSLFYKK